MTRRVQLSGAEQELIHAVRKAVAWRKRDASAVARSSSGLNLGHPNGNEHALRIARQQLHDARAVARMRLEAALDELDG